MFGAVVLGGVAALSVAIASLWPAGDPKLGTALPGRMPESNGRSFYVDGRRGVDAGPGALRRPWRTISYALKRVPLLGSRVIVRGGVYGDTVRFERRGDRRNPITLEPYQGEHVLLTAPSKTNLHAVWIWRAKGLRVRGFEITAPTANTGIKIESSESIEIVDCEIHRTGHSGLLVAGSGGAPTTGNSDIQIWNNRFHDNGGDWISQDSFWRIGDHSLYWGAVSSNTDGIDHSTYGGVIANNLFYNQPYGFQLQVGSQANGLIVTNNTFYRASQGNPAGGSIVLYTESRTPALVTRGVLVVNNLITHAANRGVYGSGGGGLMSTNMVRNNLAYGNAKGDFLAYYGAVDRVLFTLGQNFTGRRPLFVAPRDLDFSLRVRSPAIGKSDPAYTPAKDFYGQRRDRQPDIGAIERVVNVGKR